jgi:hypothetical protein
MTGLPLKANVASTSLVTLRPVAEIVSLAIQFTVAVFSPDSKIL